MAPLNESAVSLAWLVRFIAEANGAGPAPPSPNASDGRRSAAGSDTPQHRWRFLSELMRADHGPTETDIELDSDIWLCKSQSIAAGRLRAVWLPPDNLDDFAPGPSGRDALAGSGARPTQSSRLDALIADQPATSELMLVVRNNEAIASYAHLYEATAPPLVRQGQKRLIVMLNQILAWLGTAIGAPLRGIVLSPFRTPQDLEALAEAAARRIAALAETDDPDPYLERALVGMYNAASFQPGPPASAAPTRSGQGEVWRERWGWLTQDTSPDDARTAIVIAARLLANVAVVGPLVAAARGAARRDSPVALCCLRRLLLTLRTMAWAEDALQATWRLVRPTDVLCFAYAALRPNWPRHAIALSHRSSTVKPRLLKTRFWNSPFAALDATYAPQWETNNAMIWGLFASTPTIVRMPSPTYGESEWCRRESELLDYLVERCDFMRNRHLIDAAESDATNLDGLLAEPSHTLSPWPVPVRLIRPPLLNDAQAALLSAAGAVRLIGAAAGGEVEAVRQTIAALRRGSHPALPCLTNNAGGWRDYMDLLRAVPSGTAQAIDDGRLVISDQADRASQLRFPELAKNLPDFGDPRVPALGDHLAAFEWLLVEEESLLHEYAGSGFVVDCRHLSREHWERSPAYTLHRGLTSAATSVPVWFLQSAPERVDRWPIIGDFRPIFTEHFAGQFSWMQITSPPEDWFARYLAKSGVS